MAEKPPAPITAEEAEFLHPPPSYDEVMGVYNTSVKNSNPDQASGSAEVPPLAYIDILPRCLHQGNIRGRILPLFDNYSATMEAANHWLKNNPGLVAWKCETTENKVGYDPYGNLTFDLNTMLRHDATFGYQVYVRGLRLWLTKNPDPGSPSQQLGIMNVVPEKLQGQRGSDHDIYVQISFGGMYRDGQIGHTFEGLKETVAKINKRLETDPIPGTVLSVETAKIKAYELFMDTLDPEATCWSEDKMNFRRETQVVRIYYIKGPSAHEEIGIKDVVPDVTDSGDLFRPPKLQPFDYLLPKLTQWLPSNQGIRVVNIQQYDAKIEQIIRTGQIRICTDSTDENLDIFGELRMCKMLRVFYVKSPKLSTPVTPNYVTSRVFLPARTGTITFESMTKTMERIDAWLRVTGLPIFSVETVKFLFQNVKPEGADIIRSDYTMCGFSGKRWLSGIRVYFPCVYQEPHPALLPPPPPRIIESTSTSCAIL